MRFISFNELNFEVIECGSLFCFFIESLGGFYEKFSSDPKIDIDCEDSIQNADVIKFKFTPRVNNDVKCMCIAIKISRDGSKLPFNLAVFKSQFFKYIVSEKGSKCKIYVNSCPLNGLLPLVILDLSYTKMQQDGATIIINKNSERQYRYDVIDSFVDATILSLKREGSYIVRYPLSSAGTVDWLQKVGLPQWDTMATDRAFIRCIVDSMMRDSEGPKKLDKKFVRGEDSGNRERSTGAKKRLFLNDQELNGSTRSVRPSVQLALNADSLTDIAASSASSNLNGKSQMERQGNGKSFINQTVKVHDQVEQDGNEKDVKANCSDVKEVGLCVAEFFSGIGGMRLSLPSCINGLPITHVTAFDVSAAANSVYALNFEGQNEGAERELGAGAALAGGRLGSRVRSRLRRVLVDGLTLRELDGCYDIWTLSPPCQPFTTTRGAKRLDNKDNRTRGLQHLMRLLEAMTSRPRWLVLENVRGFAGSDSLQEWKQTLQRCGYSYMQFLLSPLETAGVPNHRTRYYMIAEYSARFSQEIECIHTSLYAPNSPAPSPPYVYPLSHYVLTEVDQISSSEPALDMVDTIEGRLDGELGNDNDSADINDDGYDDSDGYKSSSVSLSSLLVPLQVLSDPKVSARLSVVGPHDRTSFCFTKGYARVRHKCTGSLFWPDAQGDLAIPAYALDKSRLGALHGRVRYFHPDEVLALLGFPVGHVPPHSCDKSRHSSGAIEIGPGTNYGFRFRWPSNMPLKKRLECAGNSLSVFVVSKVMDVLFCSDQNSEAKLSENIENSECCVIRRSE